MKEISIIVLLFICILSCNTEKINTSIIEPDTIIFEKEFRIECYKTKKTKDTIQKFYCRIFDTLNEKLFMEGSFLFEGDITPRPIHWIKRYQANGQLYQMSDYTAFTGNQESEINQVITFGRDSTDTIFKESHFLKHKLSFLNSDSVLISFKYRGLNEDISDYAFTLLDGTEKYIFRSNKPNISFSIPTLCFGNDSSVLFSMIKTYKENPSDEGEFMEHIFYDVELKEN